MELEKYKKFVVDSNEALEFKFVRCAEDLENDDVTFRPEMSHQVFGMQEAIFGYTGLRVKLYYTPGWLRTYLSIEYEEKLTSPDISVKVDDVLSIVAKFLSHEFVENIDDFVTSLSSEPSFIPFGELVNVVNLNSSEDNANVQYEIFHMAGKDVNEKFLKYYSRLQNFIIWYIDCASFIDMDDERWQYFIAYEKYKNENQETAYAVAGFITVYEYYAFPSNIRPRISQVLIFPPFQKQGLASHLLNSIYKFYMPNKEVIDITVESPSLEFQLLRDFVDVCRCMSLECFAPEKMKGGFTEEMAKEVQLRFKIPKKQARRVYEILLLKTINRANEDESKWYRICVKRRLHAEYQKMGKMMNRLEDDDKELQMAKALLSNDNRLETLCKQYEELEEQYSHVLERLSSYPLELI